VTALLIAHNTFREATRDRMVAGLLGAGALLLVATQIIGPLALGEDSRLTVDLGLSGISILGFLMVLLVGTSLVAKEVERRTIYNLLSRPISRHGYLIGKWLGLVAALWLVAVCLGMGLGVLMLVNGAGGQIPAIAQAVYLAALELAVMTSIAVLFSALSTPALSALYTLGVFVVGQWSYDLRAFAAEFPDSLRALVGWIANVAPNLPIFNMRTLAAGGELTSFAHLGLASLYALVYCICILGLASAAFESREFK